MKKNGLFSLRKPKGDKHAPQVVMVDERPDEVDEQDNEDTVYPANYPKELVPDTSRYLLSVQVEYIDSMVIMAIYSRPFIEQSFDKKGLVFRDCANLIVRYGMVWNKIPWKSIPKKLRVNKILPEQVEPFDQWTSSVVLPDFCPSFLAAIGPYVWTQERFVYANPSHDLTVVSYYPERIRLDMSSEG